MGNAQLDLTQCCVHATHPGRGKEARNSWQSCLLTEENHCGHYTGWQTAKLESGRAV